MTFYHVCVIFYKVGKCRDSNSKNKSIHFDFPFRLCVHENVYFLFFVFAMISKTHSFIFLTQQRLFMGQRALNFHIIIIDIELQVCVGISTAYLMAIISALIKIYVHPIPSSGIYHHHLDHFRLLAALTHTFQWIFNKNNEKINKSEFYMIDSRFHHVSNHSFIKSAGVTLKLTTNWLTSLLSHGDEVEVKSFFRSRALNYFNEILCMFSKPVAVTKSTMWKKRELFMERKRKVLWRMSKEYSSKR